MTDPDILSFVMIRTAVAACCAAVLLAGCSADAEPDPLPPVASASPTPVALPVPSEATAETAAGAAAFARFFFTVVNRGLESGDASQVRDLSDPACQGCKNLIGAIEGEPTPGERVEGGLFELALVEVAAAEGLIPVDMRYTVTALQVLGDDGTVLEEKPASGPIDALLILERAGGSWTVRGFENVES